MLTQCLLGATVTAETNIARMMMLVFGSITIEGARNPQPRLDQKEYFAANCRIRGSAALCNTPNVAERMLLARLAKFG